MVTAEQSLAAAEEREALHCCSFIYSLESSEFSYSCMFSGILCSSVLTETLFIGQVSLVPGGSDSSHSVDSMSPPAGVVLTCATHTICPAPLGPLRLRPT